MFAKLKNVFSVTDTTRIAAGQITTIGEDLVTNHVTTGGVRQVIDTEETTETDEGEADSGGETRVETNTIGKMVNIFL